MTSPTSQSAVPAGAQAFIVVIMRVLVKGRDISSRSHSIAGVDVRVPPVIVAVHATYAVSSLTVAVSLGVGRGVVDRNRGCHGTSCGRGCPVIDLVGECAVACVSGVVTVVCDMMFEVSPVRTRTPALPRLRSRWPCPCTSRASCNDQYRRHRVAHPRLESNI